MKVNYLNVSNKIWKIEIYTTDHLNLNSLSATKIVIVWLCTVVVVRNMNTKLHLRTANANLRNANEVRVLLKLWSLGEIKFKIWIFPWLFGLRKWNKWLRGWDLRWMNRWCWWWKFGRWMAWQEERGSRNKMDLFDTTSAIYRKFGGTSSTRRFKSLDNEFNLRKWSKEILAEFLTNVWTVFYRLCKFSSEGA